TGRPGAVPAGRVADLGRDRDLGLAGGVAGQPGAPVRLPGAEVELEAAVVAVAGVDGPVAAGLALREPVPHGVAGGERRRRADLGGPGGRPADHVAGPALAAVELAGAVGDPVGHVADTLAALLHDLGRALGHRVVLLLDGARVDGLALDALLGDADV